ncbi:hypothetical protein BW38_03552 [Stenotrophomonas sp. RIT309]|jgi:hypothetical protein|uniref:hypothetical protein n=1 Tax=Stenotrophomonas sp. RIT309 TaxID=1470590 RepID=UPI00044BBF58|nr:hypothetical protein [Stenotrophomonas sp. RIT309]EZP43205.1 hypothetical protein BW38_03552 [Stenotrophomonas sp. RIT309]
MSVTQLLGPNSYLSYLDEAADGRDANTHRARVEFEPGSPVDAYVKVYHEDDAPKGLVNELIGYVLAKHAAIDVPARSAVILLSATQAGYLPAGFRPMKEAEGRVVAWCVEDVGGGTPKQTFRWKEQHGLQALRDDLKKWQKLVDVVALDAWVLNEDRNLGNLVRMAPGKYAVIDHGRVCTGNAWAVPLDRSRVHHTNMLALIAWNSENVEHAPLKVRSGVLSAFEAHADVLAKADLDLSEWLPLLVEGLEEQDVKDFLEERATFVPKHYKTAFQVLL